MENFVGIDLGTTNSAICVYDGSNTRIQKSREQNDVTPSAIYIDRRGRKYIGQRAYQQVAIQPQNCATEFKRKMGTSTPIEMSNGTLNPVECSADVLKELFGSLPEEIRKSPNTHTVVTVPAAFNQMKKNATSQAAERAGIGSVALMQEPVAAVMSYMRVRDTDGRFLIYDLGGGTFDAAIAESTGGRVTLHAHGGIEFCGGRDFDRLIRANIILPHLRERYNLPEDLSVDPTYRPILRVVEQASENAKIGLSSEEQFTIEIDEFTVGTPLQDLNGNEIDEAIPLDRETYNKLIAEKVDDTISRVRETMEECGVNSQDLDCIVWVGGPTNYLPLREKVATELGISGELSVNPMTAVAEGASLFAESIDWSSENRERKPSRVVVSPTELALSFNYTARTPTDTSKIVVQVNGQVPTEAVCEVESLDSGWISGKFPLQHGTIADLPLGKPGENTFKIVVYDAVGEPIDQQEIIITRTTATIDAIPGSHSIALEALDGLGGRRVPVYLIRKGESLPKKDSIELIAGEALEAGSSDSLKFLLWEGEIEDPIDKNRNIGCLKVEGADLDEGTVPAGADLICNYEILDSGEIKLEVEIPAIRDIFNENFYSADEGKINFATDAARVIDEARQVHNRIDQIEEKVRDPRTADARRKLKAAGTLEPNEPDSEKVQEAEQGVLDANKLINRVEKDHLKVIRQMDLDDTLTLFNKHTRQHARLAEGDEFDNLSETAQRAIDNNEPDRVFETHLNELAGRNLEILWRQPWFVIEQFMQLVSKPYLFVDRQRFEELKARGMQLLKSEDLQGFENLTPEERINFSFIDTGTVETLRDIVRELVSLLRTGGDVSKMQGLVANVLVKQ